MSCEIPNCVGLRCKLLQEFKERQKNGQPQNIDWRGCGEKRILIAEMNRIGSKNQKR